MMSTPVQQHPGPSRKSKGVIGKEVLVGFLAMALGGYNLLSYFEIIPYKLEIPQIIANIILVITGLILWVTAYKLWKYRWHSSRIF
jgi:hypothetical protein